MVTVQQVSKLYTHKKVIDDVSVSLAKGKITSFIGPNGAGKSTLLAIVSRLISADGGQIIIEGTELHKWKNKELAKQISILKQSNHITLRLKIRDLVSFGRFPYSQGNLTAEDWHFVDEAISYMELTDIEDKFIDQLSGGQLQRAYIAMVIAQNTEYILLDEPLNNLDMKHSVQIMTILRRLVKELGKTIVIVLHDINFASCYSDYIVALKDGKVINEGTPEEIITAESLSSIYDLDIQVKEIDGKRICVYYG
ncbi:ABC transporter ATP-binding protein [Bacillaceae bacterium Marseille-Q3522]|nr:ABC transporter ATP-binding protein [Bacillaceae bacterium Marseille-Q3522]